MKVLVTGNKGYIGAVLTRLLLEKGHSVIGYDTHYYHGCEFDSFNYFVPQIQKDIRAITIDDLKGIQAVIHLAGLSNDPLCNFNEELTYEINYKAAVRLARLAKKKGIERFIFASTQSLYGKALDVVYEDSPLQPLTVYGKSKLLAEQAILRLADDSFTPVFLRPSTVYGVSPMFRSDIVFNNLSGWAFTTGKIQILSDGMPWRPVIHIEDVSRAFIAAMEAPEYLVHGEVFNVGENQNYRIRDMADIIQAFSPTCIITYSEKPASDERTYQVNFDKISARLKDFYQPTWTIHKGLQQLFKSYQELGLTFEYFTQKFRRLDKLKSLVEVGRLNKELYWNL